MLDSKAKKGRTHAAAKEKWVPSEPNSLPESLPSPVLLPTDHILILNGSRHAIQIQQSSSKQGYKQCGSAGHKKILPRSKKR